MLRFLLTVATCVLIVVGQLLIRQGMRQVGLLHLSRRQLARLLGEWRVLSGVALVSVALAIWLGIIAPWHVVYAYPLFTLTYLAIVLLAWWVTGETLTMGKGFGTGILTIGLLLIGALPIDGPAFWNSAGARELLLALGLTVAGFLVWLRVLSRWQISFAYPLLSFTSIVLLPLGWAIFGIVPSPLNLLGALIVMLGIVTVIRGGQAA